MWWPGKDDDYDNEVEKYLAMQAAMMGWGNYSPPPEPKEDEYTERPWVVKVLVKDPTMKKAVELSSREVASSPQEARAMTLTRFRSYFGQIQATVHAVLVQSDKQYWLDSVKTNDDSPQPSTIT